jgi:hypothetical protein
MLDVRRLLAPLLVSAGLASWIGLLSVLCWATIGHQPRWLPEHDGRQDPTAFKKFGGRVAGALAGGREADGPGRPIGVVLGSSTLESAIDPGELGGPDGMRWLALYAHKLDLSDLDSLSRLLFRSRLAPGVIVLAINTGMLVRSPGPARLESRPFDPLLVARLLGSGRLFMAERELESSLSLLFPLRTRVNHWAWHGVLEARLDMARAMGIPVEALFSPDRDAWSVPERLDYLEDAPAGRDYLEREWDAMRGNGWFDPGAYPHDGPNAEALARLIGRARSAGCELRVVLMPEVGRLRATIPDEARRLADSAARRAAGGRAAAAIDLRDAMPDADFYDLIHVFPRRRAEFTARFASALRRSLAAGR